MQTEIKSLIESYNSNALWEMARLAQLPGTSGKKLSKEALLKLMQQEFFKPERIQASYRQLTEYERTILNRLLLHPEKITTRTFGRELVRAGIATEPPPPPEPKKEVKSYYSYSSEPSMYGRTVHYIGSVNNPKSTIVVDVLARLTRRGLVFSTAMGPTTGNVAYKWQLHPGDMVFVPSFVRHHLPEPRAVLDATHIWQPARTLHGDPQLFLRDLYLYWDTVRRTPIALIQSGYVGKRGLKQLNTALLTPDPNLDNVRQEDESHTLYLLRQVLQELKLVQVKNGNLEMAGPKNPEFWQRTMKEQVTAVLNIWLKLPQSYRLSSTQTYSGYGPNVQQACHMLLDYLTNNPHNTWQELEDILLTLQDGNTDFLFSMRSRIESNRGYYYGNREQAIKEMSNLEKRLITEVVSGFLLQLGLVELGFTNSPTDPASWEACRLTPLGAAVLQNKPFSTPEAHGQIIVQPNFQILALGPVPLHLLAQLDRFAERQKVDRSAFEYHLSRESVYAAQQMDYPVEEVQRFLETVAPNDLPQNIRRSLAEWGAHHDRIVFRRHVTLLQAADDSLLQQLFDDPAIGKLLARPIGPALALVKNKQKNHLVSALQNADRLPAVSGANPEAADKSVLIEEDGRIHSIHAVPSLHLTGRLAPFTEKSQAGWLLTAKAVSRAGGNKKKAEYIINELRKLNRGPLPASIEDKVKAWGGYYGQAAIGAVTLVEFHDQETLAELCQLAELKGLLHPFSAGKRALAVVDSGSVTAVQSTLTHLGVKITPLKV